MTTLAQQIAELEHRAADGAAASQALREIEPHLAAIAKVFGLVAADLRITDALEQRDEARAQRDALEAELAEAREEVEVVKCEGCSKAVPLEWAISDDEGVHLCPGCAVECAVESTSDLYRTQAGNARTALLEAHGELVAAGRLEGAPDESLEHLAWDIQGAVSGLLEDVPEPAEMVPAGTDDAALALLSDCAGMTGGTEPCLRTPELRARVLAFLDTTSKTAATPAKSAAPPPAVEGNEVSESPTATVTSPQPSSSGAFVVTRRDKSGRRFLDAHDRWKPGGPDVLLHVWPTREAAEAAKPRGSRVVAVADVSDLLEMDAAIPTKPRVEDVAGGEGGQPVELGQLSIRQGFEQSSEQSLLANVAVPALGQHPDVRVFADDADEAPFVVCYAAGGKRHWHCVGGGLTSDGRRTLADALYAGVSIEKFSTLIGARDCAGEVAKAMPHAGGSVEVHSFGDVLDEEEAREEARDFPARGDGDLEQQVDAAVEQGFAEDAARGDEP